MSKALEFLNNRVLKGRQSALSTQFVRFVIVGALNTGVDLLVLNLLVFGLDMGKDGGPAFMAFKAIAFTVAVANSYLLNKFWTFESSGKDASREVVPFLLVSLVGLVLNVATATLFVSFVATPWATFKALWPSIGSLMGTATGLVWNFIGYRTLVFNRTPIVEQVEGPAEDAHPQERPVPPPEGLPITPA